MELLVSANDRLVGRDGQVAGRYAPTTKPEALKKDIEKLLGSQ